MGVFDFLSGKQPAQGQKTGSALVVSPTTSAYQPQATQTNNSKDIQYPIPNANSGQLGATNLPAANGLVSPAGYTSEQLPKTYAPTPVTNNGAEEKIHDNGVREFNYAQQTPAATTQATESLPATQQTQNTQATTNPPVVNDQPLYSYTDNPIPAQELAQVEAQENTNTQTDTTSNLNTGANVPAETTNVLPALESNPVSQPAAESATPTPPTNVPSAQPQAEITQEVRPEHDIIEFSKPKEEVATSSPAQPQEVKTEVQPIEATKTEAKVEPKDIMETTTVENQVEEPTAPVSNESKESEKQTTTEVNEKPVVSTPIAETTVPPKPNTIDNTVKQELPTNKKNEEPTIEKPNIVSEFKTIKQVAFVSLNIQGVNSTLSKKVKSLATMLNDSQLKITIDSNKGYGMDIVSALGNSNAELKATFFKPIYSKYSDEANIEIPIENLTTVLFSTVFDKLNYLLRDSDAFIVPETSGLNNLLQVISLLSIQFLYFGSQKPVILFGNAWKNKINSLKDNFGLSKQELDSIYYASTPEEAMQLLQKLDSDLSEQKKSTGKVVIDLRDDDKEQDVLLGKE